MKAAIRVHENAALRGLAAATIRQAVSDLAGKNTPLPKRLAAFFWLTGPDFEVWCDWAGFDANPYKYLLPNLRQVRVQLKRKGVVTNER